MVEREDGEREALKAREPTEISTPSGGNGGSTGGSRWEAQVGEVGQEVGVRWDEIH